MTSKRIPEIASIVGVIAILLIPQALSPDSFAAKPSMGIDSSRHFIDLAQPEDPNYVADTIGDVKIRTVFNFNRDGQEIIDSFRIINQLGGYQMGETIAFQLLGGVGGDKPKLYTAVDKFYSQQLSKANPNYTSFEVDIYLFHRGDDISFRHFKYSDCNIVDYSVATLHDGDETFSGQTKFVLADAFSFQCAGYQPHCPICMVDPQKPSKSEITSTTDLRDTAEWSDVFKSHNP